MQFDHPSLDGDARALAEDVDLWLRNDSHVLSLIEQQEFSGSYARWYSRLISELVLLASGDTIQAVFTTVDAETWSIHVRVVTRRRIIEARAETQSESHDLTTRVVPRSGVREVRVEEPLGLVTRPHGREWPGSLAVTVTLDGFAEPLRFAPSNSAMFGGRYVDFPALLRSFLEDMDD